jgi:hypothetical protein
MEFIPYRVLRNEPTALRKKLEDEGELVVTVDGKPFADILLMVSRLKAQMAVRAIRSQARRDGLDKLSEEQVEDLITKTRQERKH